MKKPNKINLANYLKYSFVFSITLIIIILVVFVFFLYRNVYQTIAEAQEVTSLRQSIISEKLEKAKFSEIISNMEKKIMPDISTSTVTSTKPLISSSTSSTPSSTKNVTTSTSSTKATTSSTTASSSKKTAPTPQITSTTNSTTTKK